MRILFSQSLFKENLEEIREYKSANKNCTKRKKGILFVCYQRNGTDIQIRRIK